VVAALSYPVTCLIRSSCVEKVNKALDVFGQVVWVRVVVVVRRETNFGALLMMERARWLLYLATGLVLF
jgi:hypothetical protein